MVTNSLGFLASANSSNPCTGRLTWYPRAWTDDDDDADAAGRSGRSPVASAAAVALGAARVAHTTMRDHMLRVSLLQSKIATVPSDCYQVFQAPKPKGKEGRRWKVEGRKGARRETMVDTHSTRSLPDGITEAE